MDPQTSKRPPGDMEPDCSESAEVNPSLALKKHKLDNKVSPITIQNLPSEVLVKIFEHLNFEERLRAQRVCCRWYQLARSDVLWKYVRLSRITPSFFIQLLASLPPGVSHLRLECYDPRITGLPISLPEVMAKLHEQCLFLKTLIIEDVCFFKNLRAVHSYQTRRSKLLNAKLLHDVECIRENKLRKIVENEFCNEEDVSLSNALLPELKVLSLRRVRFSSLHLYTHITTSFLPKITVLDLSYSRPFSVKQIKSDVFSQLVDLEELYLAGWYIKDQSLLSFLKNARKLRVLDVEFSCVSDNTISALKQNSYWLEKLFLSRTNIGDIHRTGEDKDFFPNLQSLCIKYTKITPRGIEELLTECPSLKLVKVCCYKNITESWYRGIPNDFKAKLIFNEIARCDHFLDTKYCDFHRLNHS